MNNKRGLSTIVATILVIAITVVAVVLIAKVIIPFVQENLDKSTRCLSYQDYFQFKESFEYNGKEYRYNCHNQSTENLYAVSIQTSNLNDSSNIKGFKLIFSQEDSDSISVLDNQATSNNEGGIRMLDSSLGSLSVPKEGEFFTYVFNAGSAIYDEVEIMPLLASGKICPASDKISLESCSNVPLDAR